MTYFGFNDCNFYGDVDFDLLVFPTDKISFKRVSEPQIWVYFYHDNHIIGLNRLSGKTETAKKIQLWKSLSKEEGEAS